MWKRLLLVVMILMLMLMIGSKGIARADMPRVWQYDVNVSSYDVVGSTNAFAAGGYPNWTGSRRIHKILLSNSGNFVQTVTFYETATSTIAASAGLVIYLGAISGLNAGIFETTMPFALPLIWTTIAVKKSNANSNVQLHIEYR